MGFKYRLKVFLDEQTARRVIMTPEVVRKIRNTGTHVEYSSGILLVESRENHDIDEELLKALAKAIGRAVEASAEIEVNGRVKEIFKGRLDPFNPLGMSSLSEDPKEEKEEEEEEYDEIEDEEIFFDDEDFEEEIFYYNEEEED